MSIRAARAAGKAPPLATKAVFAGQLEAFAKATDATLDEAFRGIVIGLFTSVIADTPVDTGRARGNWQTSVGSYPSDPIERLDDTGAVGTYPALYTGMAIGEVRDTEYHIEDVVYLTNNLPYIGRLEYDHWSGQAPFGMMRKNVARINIIIAKAVRDAQK